MVGERSTSEQRGPLYDSVAQRMEHQVDNSSKNHRNAQRSSIASLSSSSALSIDERFNGGLNIKSFEKYAHMGQPHVIALYNFETGVDGDLEFEVGDIIMLEDIVDESWYKGRSIRTGAVGIFPMNHVEVRIPLTSGLFTNTQPKMQFVYSNRSKNCINTIRTYSHPSFRKKPVPLPKIINQSAPNYIHTNYTLCSQKLSTCNLPKRPSKIRVDSLKAKHEGSVTDYPHSRPYQGIYYIIYILFYIYYIIFVTISFINFQPLSTSLPVNNLLPNRVHVSTKPFSHSTVKSPSSLQIKSQLAPNPTPPPPPPPSSSTSTDHLQEQQQIPKPCNAPPVINSLKPRNQTAISQIAQMLQEKGIVSYRSRQMPSGAKHLYPGSHPLLVSSAPSSSERLKSLTQMNNIHDKNNNNIINGTENNNHNVNKKIQDETTNKVNNEKSEEEQTSVKTTKYHSPLLVETVLSKLLPELNRSPSRSSDSNSLNKTPNNKNTLDPRMDSSKRLDVDRKHSIENSYSTDIKNGTVTNTTTNNNISNASNHLKHSSESNKHNGIETDDGDQSTDAKSITIVKSAKLLRNNSSTTNKSNFDYNSHIRRAYTITKPPEKLITSKAYISLFSSGKSLNNNQISTTTTTAEETKTNVRCNQQSPRSESNHQYSLMDSTGESNHSKLIATNDWLIVEHEQLGNESTGELHLTVGDILKCIDSNPQVCDTRSDTHHQYSLSSSSSRKWIKCENWFGVIGLAKISNVRVIDNSNELASCLEARPRVKALYKFDEETDEDLGLSPGEIVYLFEAIDENWYRGESASTGNRGMFPATFVEVIKPL
ncbi:putative sorbin [Schistosoma mansoni]|uniref:putative sorbin n=1 Tax=Schistosoma mansoni TaxID=6183 RepID=UPI00022DC32E|nr:putative sorbin [Schistosoma mansoni]|eukprot:XP_018649785.1 putative sorbin [Schistosoma mansoni]